jgi:hypothetical protein
MIFHISLRIRFSLCMHLSESSISVTYFRQLCKWKILILRCVPSNLLVILNIIRFIHTNFSQLSLNFLLFSSETFYVPFWYLKILIFRMHNSNFARCFIKKWSLVCHINWRRHIKDVWNRAQSVKLLPRKGKWHKCGENCIIMDDNMCRLFSILTFLRKVTSEKNFGLKTWK